MPSHQRLCFIVADGGHVRFVHPAADNGLHTTEALDSKSLHKRTHDLVSDRPGRTSESATTARHAVSSRTDPHEQEKVRFAETAAHMINETGAAGAFDTFVLVAPPDTLAVLEAGLDVITRAKLKGTLAKDLVKVPDDALGPHLREWIGAVKRPA